MARTATKKQRGFAKSYVETGNGSKSALAHYDTKDPDVAKVIASENLTKPNVRDLIEGYARKATKNIQTLAENAEKEEVRLKANIDQLDRAGYKPTEKTVNINVEVEALPEIQALTEKLNALYGGTSEPSHGGQSGIVGNQTQDKE